MYVAVLAVVLGQVLLSASRGLFAQLVFFGTTVHAFVRTYEEPTLREAFGPAFEEFCATCPAGCRARPPGGALDDRSGIEKLPRPQRS